MNEEKAIGTVLDDVHEALQGTGYDYEILVVDTDSRDNTREIAASKGAQVIIESRRGYGRAYKTGFQEARGRVIVTLDADCTYPAEEIPNLYDIVHAEGLDFLTTNRFGKMESGSMCVHHILGNKALTLFLTILFGVKIRDSQSGMWALRKDMVEKLSLTSDGMPMSEEIKIEASRVGKLKEVPIEYRCRVGEAKLLSFKDGMENMLFLMKKRLNWNVQVMIPPAICEHAVPDEEKTEREQSV